MNLRVVGVPSVPTGFDGIACFSFVNRFHYGNFWYSRKIPLRVLKRFNAPKRILKGTNPSGCRGKGYSHESPGILTSAPPRSRDAVGPILGMADEFESLPAEETTAGAPVMLRFSRKAMATTFELVLPYGTASAHECAAAALDEIDRLEAQLTVYRDTSEVSQLNARAFHHPVHVQANLFQLLAMAQIIQRDTEGAFDISVGALIKSWGFYRRAGRVPTTEESLPQFANASACITFISMRNSKRCHSKGKAWR